MNFYFSIYQIIESSQRLEGSAKALTAHALSASPRDGQANRAILEQCGNMLQGVKELLSTKAHFSKVQLRRTAILFQMLEIAHRRVLNLAGAFAGEKECPPAAPLLSLLTQAKKDYQDLRTGLYDRMGVPIFLELPDEGENRGLRGILLMEAASQEEILKLAEKAIEVFDEERDLSDRLALVRKNLLEERKKLKRLLASSPAEREPTASLDRHLDLAHS